jgi:hypothetical protein
MSPFIAMKIMSNDIVIDKTCLLYYVWKRGQRDTLEKSPCASLSNTTLRVTLAGERDGSVVVGSATELAPRCDPFLLS